MDGSCEDRLDDLGAAPVAHRVAAVVDRVRDVEVLRDPLVQLLLLRLGQRGQGQARAGGQVGEVGAGAARYRVDRRRRPPAGGRARASRAAVSWSSSSPSTRITPNCRIAASTTVSAPVSLPVCEAAMPGARLGPADLDGHDGYAAARRAVRGEEEPAAVLEPFHVARDRPDLGLLGEVRDEVRGLQIRLVARGRPVREPYAQLLHRVEGAALVARLRDEGDGRSCRGRRGTRENAFRFVFGPSSRMPERATAADRDDCAAAPSSPVSAKPDAKATANFTLAWASSSMTGSGSRRAVRRGRRVRAVRRRRRARDAEDGLAGGVHGVEAGARRAPPTRSAGA